MAKIIFKKGSTAKIKEKYKGCRIENGGRKKKSRKGKGRGDE